MLYLFVALYLFIGHLTYVRAFENYKYSMAIHVTVMFMFPIFWTYALYVIVYTVYRSYKNKNTINEEIDEEIKKLEKELEKYNE